MLIAKSYYGREAHQGIQRLSEGIHHFITINIIESLNTDMKQLFVFFSTIKK